MTTLLETKQLTIPSTWSKRSAAWAVSYGMTQTEVDALESELAAFRQQRDANTRATIAALLPEYEARAAGIWKRLQAARTKLEAGKQARGAGLIGTASSTHGLDKLQNDVTALWREYAPLAADISAMRTTWERMTILEEAA